MKTIFSAVAATVWSALLSLPTQAAQPPKKVLVVNVIESFRHSVIPTTSKVLAQLAQQSGAFTVDVLEEAPSWPGLLRKPAPLPANATEEQKAAFKIAQEKFEAESAAYPDKKARWVEESLKVAMEKLRPESLKEYDAVIFNSTVGNLPLPDPEGFLAWIRSGKAFIGFHGAADCCKKWPGYVEMIGASFETHGPQLSVDCINADPTHPATKMLGPIFSVPQEEVYQFKNYDRTKVHELLVLDKKPDINNRQPGHYPISWCKQYGEGRVFYTALGHREDIVSTDTAIKDRKNPVEISKAVQEHMLGGILWALGLQPGDATPQNR